MVKMPLKQKLVFFLVGWSLMSLFSKNMAISETKGQGGELSSDPVKEG